MQINTTRYLKIEKTTYSIILHKNSGLKTQLVFTFVVVAATNYCFVRNATKSSVGHCNYREYYNLPKVAQFLFDFPYCLKICLSIHCISVKKGIVLMKNK